MYRTVYFSQLWGMEQMMKSDDNGGRSVKKELIYNWMM
jgi:hypothetical protein